MDSTTPFSRCPRKTCATQSWQSSFPRSRSAVPSAKPSGNAPTGRSSPSLSPSVLDIFPNTKQALRRCTQRRKCGRFRPFDRLHDYFFMRWYSLAYNDLLTPVTCFKSDTQEPYVVVRKSPDLPRFDERFVNYAYNKVQWIEHLRYRGYRFSVLTMGFAVDMPHPL